MDYFKQEPVWEKVFKGFYGKYDVEIEIDGNVINKEINLSAKGNNAFIINI